MSNAIFWSLWLCLLDKPLIGLDGQASGWTSLRLCLLDKPLIRLDGQTSGWTSLRLCLLDKPLIGLDGQTSGWTSLRLCLLDKPLIGLDGQTSGWISLRLNWLDKPLIGLNGPTDQFEHCFTLTLFDSYIYLFLFYRLLRLWWAFSCTDLCTEWLLWKQVTVIVHRTDYSWCCDIFSFF